MNRNGLMASAFLMGILYATDAMAADWRPVHGVLRPGLTVEIDAGSLVWSGDSVTAWTRDTYESDQLMFQRGAFLYRTSTTRTEFDCAKRTFKLLTFFYSDEKGAVKQRTTESELAHLAPAGAVPETLAEAMLTAACALRR